MCFNKQITQFDLYTQQQVYLFLQDLRQQLDRLLEDKIIHPGVTTWSRTEKEGALMHAILELISTEESVGGKDVKYHRKSRLGHNS